LRPGWPQQQQQQLFLLLLPVSLSFLVFRRLLLLLLLRVPDAARNDPHSLQVALEEVQRQ